MSTLEQDVKQMLRWYPRRWRDQHGDALIGLHMDRADGAGGDPRLSSEDRAAMRAAGLFERTRHPLPIVTGVLGTLSITVGYVLALVGNNAVGNPLWLFVGPLLLSLSLWSLRASRDGRWSINTVVPALASAFAAVALLATFNIAILRDGDGITPGMDTLWALGAISAAFIGITVAIAAAPGLQRGGMPKDWALAAGFVGGFLGTIPLCLGLLVGPVAAATGGVLLWLAIRSARRGSSTPLFSGAQPESA
ncbi:hypothetical protein [Microbacterium sp.]|jgi:hypothetical protein|uniref:hypothetical protein n=1 Tax=Microbacterium sp. TaxID=51671 RepID=UPI0025EB8173|nr:hypothetical protein [Microbacterium sp.]MBT9607206.1 hypothetical protein [Microbacterium sp.]